jgi:hypothetical protein
MALGNATGFLGPWIFALLAGLLVWGLACWRCQRAVSEAHRRLSDSAAETRALEPILGPSVSWLLALSRLFLCVVLATSVLALAGFAFNEVFVYRFPNMGFTFVLLTLICGAHLSGDKIPRALQTLCGLGAMLGFGAVALTGALRQGVVEPGDPAMTGLAGSELLVVLAPAVILFMGFELADASRSGPPRSRMPWGLIGLLAMACCFGLFATAGLHHAPADKLANTSVAHMSLGRRVLGDAGRYLAGGAAILGSVAAVNALLLSWRTWFCQRLAVSSGGGWLTTRAVRSLFTAVLPFAAVALLLWGGWAGEPVLEKWIAGATAVYFLAYAGVGLAAARLSTRPGSALPAIILSLALAGATIYGAVRGVG